MTNTGKGAVRVGSHCAYTPEWLYILQCLIWLLYNLTCLQIPNQQRDCSSSLTQE